jgi:putative transposase
VIGFKIQRLMALKVETLTGAEPGARTSDRLNPRIGYSHRDRCIRTGRVELRVPKLGKGSYLPTLPEPHRMAEGAPTAVIQGADFRSVSIRSVGDPVLAMGMSGISKGQMGVLGMEIVDVCPQR